MRVEILEGLTSDFQPALLASLFLRFHTNNIANYGLLDKSRENRQALTQFRSGGLPCLAFTCFFRPSVFKRNGAIEDELVGGAVLVEGEVGKSFELIAKVRSRVL